MTPSTTVFISIIICVIIEAIVWTVVLRRRAGRNRG